MVLCLSIALRVQAGPPFQTDDPEPVEYRHHELYIASEQTRTAAGSAGASPLVELSYGAAADLQIHIAAPLAFDNPRHAASHRGLGDIEAGIKYRFVQETENSPMISVFPLLEVPTGNADHGLGNGASQLFLPIWLQKTWGEWQSYGGGGYWINRATDAKSHWFFGWQLQRQISAQLTLGGEIYHSTAAVAGEGSTSGFNIGGDYDFDGRNHLLFSMGRGLIHIEQSNQLSSYIGYLRTW